VNLEQYKKWLEKNGNQEEQKAYEVVNEIIEYHTKEGWSEKEIEELQVYPRHILTKDKNRIEFDLVIKIKWKTKVLGTEKYRFYERLIGVEFKETDIPKVITQAIARREFVDYMYIATWAQYLNYHDVFLLSYFGIGWVTWRKHAVLVIPAKYSHHPETMQSLLNSLIEKRLAEVFDDKIKSLLEFGVENAVQK